MAFVKTVTGIGFLLAAVLPAAAQTAFNPAATHVIRSREYETQGTKGQFGAVDLTVRF